MSEKEVKNCPKCGGEMERRRLREGRGGWFIILSQSESLWSVGKHEKVLAYACQKCGFVELCKEMKD